MLSAFSCSSCNPLPVQFHLRKGIFIGITDSMSSSMNGWTAPRHDRAWTWLLPGGLGERNPPGVMPQNFHYNVSRCSMSQDQQLINTPSVIQLFMAICMGEPRRLRQRSPLEVFNILHEQQANVPDSMFIHSDICERTRAFVDACGLSRLDHQYARVLMQQHEVFRDVTSSLPEAIHPEVLISARPGSYAALRSLECQRMAIQAVQGFIARVDSDSRTARNAAAALFREMCAVIPRSTRVSLQN